VVTLSRPAPREIVVVKVGGSLLGWPALPRRLATLVAGEKAQGTQPVLIAGGGPFADAIRALDRRHRLGEERSHALAMRALDLCAEVLHSLVAGIDTLVVRDVAALEGAWSTNVTPIMAPRQLIEHDERRSNAPLPHCWQVTSDTIAARVAKILGASRLVLCKSAPLGRGEDRAAARARGLHDSAFPGPEAETIHVIYRNLRNPADRGCAI
jgi:aspartokinase-like uncharacterized kinase